MWSCGFVRSDGAEKSEREADDSDEGRVWVNLGIMDVTCDEPYVETFNVERKHAGVYDRTVGDISMHRA